MSQKGSKKNGRNKRKPANIAYKAEDRFSKNKRRRAARQSKIEAAHAEKRGVVCVKRKLGAVRRLERRIAAGNTWLSETLNKAKSALERAKEAA